MMPTRANEEETFCTVSKKSLSFPDNCFIEFINEKEISNYFWSNSSLVLNVIIKKDIIRVNSVSQTTQVANNLTLLL